MSTCYSCGHDLLKGVERRYMRFVKEILQKRKYQRQMDILCTFMAIFLFYSEDVIKVHPFLLIKRCFTKRSVLAKFKILRKHGKSSRKSQSMNDKIGSLHGIGYLHTQEDSHFPLWHNQLSFMRQCNYPVSNAATENRVLKAHSLCCFIQHKHSK